MAYKSHNIQQEHYRTNIYCYMCSSLDYTPVNTFAIRWIIYSTVNKPAISWTEYCTVNISRYIYHVERTNLQCGSISSASYISVHIYATYIMVIFCRVQHTNTTPLSGYSLVVGLTMITDKPCNIWCGDII